MGTLVWVGLVAGLIAGIYAVRNHVQHILAKLDAHSQLEAVAVASRWGLLHSGRDGAVRPS